MKTAPALLLTALLLAACGDDGAGATVEDPAADVVPSADARPTAVPAADGPVRTRGTATVMDTGDGPPELCLGAVAESYPPQCGGPPIAGWDWGSTRGMHERQGQVRWGGFAVTGTWDGTTFTVTEAVPAALHDPPAVEPSPTPPPARTYTEDDLARIQRDVQDLPGAQGAYVADGHVLVDVTYDDGSLQAWVDEAHGGGVVLVSSMLVDV